MYGGFWIMKVSEIMSRNVECIFPDTSIKEAAEKMRSLDVGFLPVCQEDKVIGVLTDRDIAIRHVADGQNPYRVKARDIMTPNVLYSYEDQDVEEVARYMQEYEIRRVIIVDRTDHLAGVVSLGDLAQAAGEESLAGETLKDIAEAA
jgi:CBS domain-containing protein